MRIDGRTVSGWLCIVGAVVLLLAGIDYGWGWLILAAFLILI